ncbi:MAG: DUF3108 domain-containing protein [Candidatus Omnitrophica bacterium]|jgi:hypothetical protein|nr:DUF3108 domain-containing protein [Candidatus Omnitrophota bacterium]
MTFITACCKYYFLSILLATTACAYRPQIIKQCIPKQEQCFLPKEPARLSYDEKLIYGASWRGIPSAKLILQIKGIEEVNNRDCYHITATANPNSFFSIFFNVKYEVDTYIDKASGLSLKFHKKKSFGRKISEETIIFDRDKKIAKCKFNDNRKKDVEIGENTHDLLSFLYYFRMKGLEPEGTYDFNILYAGRIWPIKMKVNGIYLMKLKGERINVFSVRLTSELINAIIGSPALDAYVSANEKLIPVFFTANTRIGQSDSVLLNFDCVR